MKKFLLAIMVLSIFCYSGCGKQEESTLQGDSVPQEETAQPEASMPQSGDARQMTQDELPVYENQIYERLYGFNRTFEGDYFFTDCRAYLTREEASGSCWTFGFDDELDIVYTNADISIKVEEPEDKWVKSKYTIYRDGEEVDSFEAMFSGPSDMRALYVDITGEGVTKRDIVIIGSLRSGSNNITPWTYAYNLENNERISLFDSDGESSSLTEKQKEQVKAILEKDEKLSELLPDAEIIKGIWEGPHTFGGIPMVDPLGNVYFNFPIRGSLPGVAVDHVYGDALLLLTYNADTKEFDVCDVVYELGMP